jgi:MarR family transcriptional regulator, organic hydroperoxide resistance regulator
MKRQGGFLIAKVHQSAGRIFARMLRDRRIETNPAQGRILFVLSEEGPMSIHELARRVSLGKSTLTSALDRLESQGHVVRVRCPGDRRKILIELTPRNRAMHRLYEEVSREMTDVFYAGLTNNEIAGFEQILQRILDNLTRFEPGCSGKLVSVPYVTQAE